MQNSQDLEPIVRIRELKKDRVNFVLENVDLAYAFVPNLSCHFSFLRQDSSCHWNIMIYYSLQ